MDPASLLLQEAAELLGNASPRTTFASEETASATSNLKSKQHQQIIVGGGGGIFSNDRLAFKHDLASPSLSSPSFSATTGSDSSPMCGPVGGSKRHPSNTLALCMLHDLAATQELIDLSDAVTSMEMQRLKEAAKLLTEEKRLRAEQIESLRAELDQVEAQKRRLLAPFMPSNNNDDAVSVRSGGIGGNQMIHGGHNNNTNNVETMSRGRGYNPAGGAPSMSGSIAPSARLLGAGTAAGAGGPVLGGAGAASHRSSSVNGGPGSGNRPTSGANASKSAVGQQRKLVAEIPGVSFGALTTAASASRYAKHWADDVAAK